ncbi:hypothetical protein K470DRAFT_263169 [Piedraia hortae CBS 480.64]|uniref:Uncharacterized protein n=1 Tax=Piedraia hortae CBS 480.64 TaxID=1314780 RepID=A0A6A7C4S0_9PEZI|nr:hypothetical protein K470DRAFT_263169 [Piedraia hortae CBS 480.64]
MSAIVHYGFNNFQRAEALTVIYADILRQAADLDTEWLRLFNKIIKLIAVLHSPLTILALTDLLGQEDNMTVSNAQELKYSQFSLFSSSGDLTIALSPSLSPNDLSQTVTVDIKSALSPGLDRTLARTFAFPA